VSVRLTTRHERFRIEGGFTISRGSRTHADVVVVELEDGGIIGRGECVPYARYGESIDSVRALIEAQRLLIEKGLDRAALQRVLPPGAARNALDAASWDLDAKRQGSTAWELAGLAPPGPVTTAFTISLGVPETMAAAAREARDRPLLKVKLGGEGDLERVAAVREAAPAARLMVDANEAWSRGLVERYLEGLAGLGVELVEQPLPAGEDAMLADVAHPVPVGADESVHATDDLAALRGRYEVVNLKLDKTGGLTEALRFKERAHELGFELMVGCMLGSSLSMAPAILAAQGARFVDLDGPLLLAEDREPHLRYEGSLLYPAPRELWG
jgi:L-alanine-DL-glutamate epimerase-like enolase superfamily enzyme